jgi:hypothetical protein
MDFNKHASGTQHQIDRLQNIDELELFKDEILGALAPLIEVPSSRRTLIRRTHHDLIASMPSYQCQPWARRSSKQNILVFAAMITVVGGALIGVTVTSARLAGLSLDDLSVARWVTQLIGTSTNSVKNDAMQTILKGTTEQAEPSPLSSQALATEEASVEDQPPSSQTMSSSAGPIQPANLAQPAAPTPDPSQDSSSRKDEIATPTTNEGKLGAPGDDEFSSPFAIEKRNSELYRQYLAWQAKLTADAHASIASERKPRSKQSD